MGEFAKFYIRLGTLFDPKGLKDAEKGIKKTNKSVGGLSSAVGKLGAMFAGGAAIYKMISFAKSAWTAYAKQEEITAKLNQALRSQGIYSDALSNHLQKLASDIQKVTTVGDEDSLAMMQLALSMGITSDKVGEATRQAIGLSKAYGVDLNSAMKMVALATAGEYTMLARYIPQLRTLTDKTEQAALVNKLLADGFKIATAEAQTTSGKMKQLSNKWGDAMEQMAARAIPAIELVIEWINAAIGYVDALIWEWDKLFKKDAITSARKELEILNKDLESSKISMATASRWAGENSVEYKNAAANAAGYSEKIEVLNKKLKELTAAPKPTARPALPSDVLPGAGKSEADLKKEAESRLKNVDGWYLSAKGIEETRFSQWLYDNQIVWDQLSLEQKETTMSRVQETYAKANSTMAGSFAVSIDRMKAAGMGWAQAWDGMWGNTLSGMTDNVKTFLTASGNMFENMRTLLDDIFKSIASAFVSMVAQMIAKWLLLQAVTGLSGLGWGGPLMALLGSKAEGGPIKETGPYLLHKGEEVIPADIANAVRRSASLSSNAVSSPGATKSSASITNNINIFGSGKADEDIGALCQKLTEATKNGLRQAGEMANVITKVGIRKAGITGL